MSKPKQHKPTKTERADALDAIDAQVEREAFLYEPEQFEELPRVCARAYIPDQEAK